MINFLKLCFGRPTTPRPQADDVKVEVRALLDGVYQRIFIMQPGKLQTNDNRELLAGLSFCCVS